MSNTLVRVLVSVLIFILISTSVSAIDYLPNFVPIMTSNTTPAGNETWGSEIHPAGVYPASNVFNHVNATNLDGWATSESKTGWIAIRTWTSHVVKKYVVWGNAFAGESTRPPRDWTFQGSNGTCTSWDVLDTQTGQTFDTLGTVRSYEISNNVSYDCYRMDITANNGATITALAEIELHEVPPVTPVASFSSKNVSVVTNGTSQGWAGLTPFIMQFNDTSSNTPTAWNYTAYNVANNTEFILSYSRNPTITFPYSGNFSVELNVSNGAGFDKTDRYALFVNVSPSFEADFTADKWSGLPGVEIAFTDLTKGLTPDAYNWSFGDGGLSTLKNPSHIFEATGVYTVNLTVVNGTIYSTKLQNVQVFNALPVADFTASNWTGSPILPVLFTDTSTGTNITAWNWSFGDGTVSSTQNPPVHYYDNGTYEINLTVMNDGGASTKLQNVSVNYFSTDFTGTPRSGIIPLSVSFTQTTSGGFLVDSYYWDFGDGSTDTVQNPTHIYSTVGSHTVHNAITNGTLTVWNNKTAYITTVVGYLNASFTASNTSSYDEPLFVQFTDTSTGANATINSWDWAFGDSTTSALQNPSHTYTSPGTYTVSLTVTNTTASLTDTNSTTVEYKSPYPSNVSQNFMMNTMYPTNIRVKDSETLALINGVSLTVGGANYILDNGILSTNFEYGSHTFTLENVGYYSKTTSLFVVGNSTFTILMEPSIVAEQQKLNLLYPHEVRIIAIDVYGNRLANVNVTSVMLNTTVTGTNWFETLFGISSSATPVENTTMVGYTDSYGSIVFPMISSGKYRISFSESTIGVNQQLELYPDQAAYSIVLATTATAAIPFSGDYINATLTTVPLGASVALNMTYIDLSDTTEDITFYVKFANQSSAYSHTFVSQSVVNTSYVVSNTANAAYVWGFNANNTRFGWQNQSNGITLKGVTELLYDPFSYKGGW